MDGIWHTSGELFEASGVFVGVRLGSSAAVDLVGSMGSRMRCFDFVDFASGKC